MHVGHETPFVRDGLAKLMGDDKSATGTEEAAADAHPLSPGGRRLSASSTSVLSSSAAQRRWKGQRPELATSLGNTRFLALLPLGARAVFLDADTLAHDDLTDLKRHL